VLRISKVAARFSIGITPSLRRGLRPHERFAGAAQRERQEKLPDKGAGLAEIACPSLILTAHATFMLTVAVRQYSKRTA
jgi:hypothetical protein